MVTHALLWAPVAVRPRPMLKLWVLCCLELTVLGGVCCTFQDTFVCACVYGVYTFQEFHILCHMANTQPGEQAVLSGRLDGLCVEVKVWHRRGQEGLSAF